MCNPHCTEPSLDELFGDVAIKLLMRRDGVTESDVRALLDWLRLARAKRCGEPTLEPGAVIGAGQLRDRENDNPSSRSAGSPDARPFPIRLI